MIKYQLVLQLPASSIKDYDEIIELEDTIINGIGGLGEVDGHDVGSGEANIFVHTDKPQLVFERVVSLLGTKDYMPDLRVAFRKIGKDEFIILHPSGLNHFSIT